MEKGENFVTLEVKAEARLTGKDPCEILAERLVAEKNKPETERDGNLIKAILQAEKFLGCRNKAKRRER